MLFCDPRMLTEKSNNYTKHEYALQQSYTQLGDDKAVTLLATPRERSNSRISSSPREEGRVSTVETENLPKWRKILNYCCSRVARNIYCGIIVLSLVTSSWVGATQFLKATYIEDLTNHSSSWNSTEKQFPNSYTNSTYTQHYQPAFSAPFFTTWFCSLWTMLFFPLYLIALLPCYCTSNKARIKNILTDSVQNFREKGFTLGTFLSRSLMFCLLSVLTNYLYIKSLGVLECTVVTALFATNASFVYLLSWVILHDQFVGIRIVAVILSNTGIALLAYMDGVKQTPTVGGVVLAAAAAAGSAIYKVMFKKVIGHVSFGQVSLFFSLIGLLNAILLWPVVLILSITGVEIVPWTSLPWVQLCGAASLSLAANLLANFSIIITYENFITLGLIAAVPASATYDVIVHGVVFAGMKLAGIIMICIGFFLVLFPYNWSDLITRFIRRTRTKSTEETIQVGKEEQ